MMYVAGEWTVGAREEDVRSPYDGEVVGAVAVASADDAERAPIRGGGIDAREHANRRVGNRAEARRTLGGELTRDTERQHGAAASGVLPVEERNLRTGTRQRSTRHLYPDCAAL